MVFFTEWQWRAVGHYQILCKALRVSELTEIACYFGKCQLHTRKNIKWSGAARCFRVTRLPLCKMCHYTQISCFLSRRTSQVATIQKSGWQMPLVAPLRHEGQYCTSYLWDTQGRRPGGEWPAVVFPRGKRTDLLMDCPPGQFSFFSVFFFWRGGKNHQMLEWEIVAG